MPTIQPTIEGITIAILFGLLQSIFVIIAFANKQRLRKHRFLLLFIAALMFTQLYAFLVQSGLMAHTLFLFNTNVPVMLLFGPFAFCYTLNLLGQQISMRSLVCHLFPFLFYFGYSFHFFLQDPALKYNILVELLGLQVPLKEFIKVFPFDPWKIQGWVVVELLSLHLVIYALVAFYKIHCYKIQSQGKYQKEQIQWLKFLNALLLAGGSTLFLSEGGIINGYVFFETPFPKFSTDLFSTIAMYATSLYLIKNSEFLNQKVKKYIKSSLSKQFMQEKIKTIKQAIEEEKLYLNPDFSLPMLSSKTGMSRHHISQIINVELNCNFSKLVNNYRIEEAKRLLQEERFIKMEQLAYQIGYKSKSSFFIAFKKATNLTPAQYRNLAATV